jgi:hypothetical protein
VLVQVQLDLLPAKRRAFYCRFSKLLMTTKVFAYSFGSTLGRLAQLSGGKDSLGPNTVNRITELAHKHFDAGEAAQFDRGVLDALWANKVY